MSKYLNLPPMKFKLGDKVRFTFNGNEMIGIVKIALWRFDEK